MIESFFDTTNKNNAISKYNEIRKNIPSSIAYSINEEIKEGDLIQYTGVEFARRGLTKSKITKCLKVEKNDFSQYKKIYYVRNDNGAVDWVNNIYFKKIRTEKIDKNLKPNDYIVSLEYLTGARDLYEVFPIYEIIRRDDNTIQSIEYLDKNNQIKKSICNTFGENVGFLKLIQNSDINRFFTSNAYSDNSYISIIKNLIK